MDKLSMVRGVAIDQIQIEKKTIDSLTFTQKDLEEARVILQTVSKEVETMIHKHFSRIVTKCLKVVWGEDAYDFEIRFVSKRGQTEAEIVLLREGHPLDPMDSTGGGVIDVASFALRLTALSLTEPRGRLFLALDEPFKNVSADLRPRIARMLELLAEELGFQFLLSTHMKSLKLGTVVELE